MYLVARRVSVCHATVLFLLRPVVGKTRLWKQSWSASSCCMSFPRHMLEFGCLLCHSLSLLRTRNSQHRSQVCCCLISRLGVVVAWIDALVGTAVTPGTFGRVEGHILADVLDCDKQQLFLICFQQSFAGIFEFQRHFFSDVFACECSLRQTQWS